MATIIVQPEQVLREAADVLAEIEDQLGASGVNVPLLNRWLNQTLLLRELRASHMRGELVPIEYDSEEGDY